MISRIKFYADCPDGQKNKLFCYSCNELALHDFFERQFLRGLRIRAAWFEKKDVAANVVHENIRFNAASLQYFFDYSFASPMEKYRMKSPGYYDKYVARFNEIFPNLK